MGAENGCKAMLSLVMLLVVCKNDFYTHHLGNR